MKIKENHSDYFFIVNKAINKLYQKKIIISFILLTTLTIYSFSLIYYGMVLQKIQVAATFQQIVFDGQVTKLNIIPNYFKGLFSNPDEFRIDLNFKDIKCFMSSAARDNSTNYLVPVRKIMNNVSLVNQIMVNVTQQFESVIKRASINVKQELRN